MLACQRLLKLCIGKDASLINNLQHLHLIYTHEERRFGKTLHWSRPRMWLTLCFSVIIIVIITHNVFLAKLSVSTISAPATPTSICCLFINCVIYLFYFWKCLAVGCERVTDMSLTLCKLYASRDLKSCIQIQKVTLNKAWNIRVA